MKRFTWRTTAVVFLALSATSPRAAEYDVRQISTNDAFSREPVISDNGVAVWAAYSERNDGLSLSEIVVYSNGNSRTLVPARDKNNPSNMRPVVQGSNLVWTAVLAGPRGNPSWVLREVPEPSRDEPAPELPAKYSVFIEPDGKQVWSTQETNLPPAETNATDTTPPVETNITALSTNVAAPPLEPEPPPYVEPPADTFAQKDTARRDTSGETEIMLWQGDSDIRRITRDNRDDLAPSVWGSTIAWQKAKGWPFGWEIMVWADGEQIQLTTNYYYDMAPKVHGHQVVWYGWDGQDFEIYLYDHEKRTTIQITSNRYDDVSPSIWDGTVVWEGYAGVDADVFQWKDGQIRKLSENIEDDLSPQIWNGQVVWQGFDGDDFEIYLFDGDKTIKLTSNTYDDLSPDIRDGLVCWMGYYENWDSEIFVWDGGDVTRLTDNDHEDREPSTAGGRVIWQSEPPGKSLIFLAEPKK